MRLRIKLPNLGLVIEFEALSKFPCVCLVNKEIQRSLELKGEGCTKIINFEV